MTTPTPTPESVEKARELLPDLCNCSALPMVCDNCRNLALALDAAKAAAAQKRGAIVSPAVYAGLVPILAERARELGYAIAVHGSMRRDLDLVAVPWTDDAVQAEELVRALAAVILIAETKIVGPEQKPHGRLAWSLILDLGAVIDLSVTPRSDDVPLREIRAALGIPSDSKASIIQWIKTLRHRIAALEVEL